MNLQLDRIQDPFPVNTPFKTEVDLHRFERPLHELPQETVFQYDEQYPAVIAEKLNLLQTFPDHSICYLTDDLASLERCLWQLAAKAAEDQPAYLSWTAESFKSALLGQTLTRDGQLHFEPSQSQLPDLSERCYEHLQTQHGIRRLCTMLALSIQEDMTLMRQPKAGQVNAGQGKTDSPENSENGSANGYGNHADVAECFMVVIPTHWDPAQNLGRNFSEIHQRVGDNAGLKKSHPALMNAMVNKGPFVRYSWALSRSSALSQNPIVLDKHSAEAAALINTDTPMDLMESFHFRVERQTFLPFPEFGRGLFAIHIYQKPLLDKLTTQARVDRLADSIESMSPATRAYRAMTDWADLLVDALRGYQPK